METETESLIGHVTAAGKDGLKGETGEKRETAEGREQIDEEAMAADQEEVHRDRDQDCEDIGVSNLCLVCGFQGLNQVKMSARHAMRLSRGEVRSPSKKQMSRETMNPRDGHSGGKSGSKKNSKAVKGNNGEHWRQQWQCKNSSKGCGDKSNKGSNRIWKS